MEIPVEFLLELFHDVEVEAGLFDFAEDEGGVDAVAFEGAAEIEVVFAGPAFGFAAGAGVNDEGAVGIAAEGGGSSGGVEL